MNDNNDFLKGYKDKNSSVNEKSAPSKPADDVKDEGMSFEEKPTFQKKSSDYSQRSYYNSRSGAKSKKLKNTIAIGLTLFSILLVIIAIVVIKSGGTVVPDFTGWARNDFMLWASENEVLSQIDEQFSDTVEADTIYDQNPKEGEKVKKGDFVKVFVSKGPDQSIELDIPDFKNMTSTQIEAWAEQNYMTKVRITSQHDAVVPLGYVIEYEINDNTVIDKIKRDTPIYIVVSKGPEQEQSKDIEIPDFKTMGISETVIFAQENGLNLQIDKQYDDYIPANSIISQSVAKETIVHPGDDIKIIVSLGKKVLMISFKSYSIEEAPSRAAQLGISYNISERYSSSKKGRLIWQSIEEGTEIKEDMHLDLRYSLGSKIFIGNYVGMKQSEIQKWLEAENLLGARACLNVTYTKNSAEPGTIIQQSISDTYIYRDTTIKVVVSSGDIIYTPDFVAPSDSLYEDVITREKALEMADGLDITLVFVEAAVSDGTVRRAGEVWYQSIAAGKEINAGTTVTLKYNPLGTTVQVPDFTGNTQTQVEGMSEYSKLTITFVEGDYKIDYAGQVYSQSIEAETIVAQGTAITLYVSPEEKVTVPDFEGMTKEEAESTYGSDFNLVFETEQTTDPTKVGKIISQDLTVGNLVAKDSTATLTVGVS